MRNKRYLILFVAITICSGCATTYSHKPIEMYVVDTETNKPLEGVIVVAQWSLSRGSVGGNIEVGTLKVLETVSDIKGRVLLPGWGPVTSTNGYLDYRGAQLIFFKRGFNIFATQNTDTRWRAKHPDQSQWDGKTIKLKRYEKPFSEYVEHIAKYDRRLDELRYGDDCEWKEIPLILIEMQKIREKMDKEGVKLQGWRLGAQINKVTDVYSGSNCGSPQEYFEKYLQ